MVAFLWGSANDKPWVYIYVYMEEWGHSEWQESEKQAQKISHETTIFLIYYEVSRLKN